MALLESYSLGEREISDEMIWALDEEKGFSVRSMYDGLRFSAHHSSPGECLWNPLIQIKVSFLMWELWWNRVSAIVNLIRNGMYISNMCCLCMADEESASHLFLHYPWMRGFWDHLLYQFGVDWVQPRNMRSLLYSWPKQELGTWSNEAK